MKAKWAALAALLLFVLWLARVVVDKTVEEKFSALRNFKPEEFGGWAALMDEDLLLKLDRFADKVKAALPGAAIVITDSGRQGEGGSQHYLFKAVDIRKVDLPLQTVYKLALDCGFKGFGAYAWGYHLDVRAGKLATWGRVYLPGNKYEDITLAAWAKQAGERWTI